MPRLRRGQRLPLLLLGAFAVSYFNKPDLFGRYLSSIFESESEEESISLQGGENEDELKCPAVVERMKGIYKNPEDDPDKKFENVILVTAASSAFEDYLRNWELHVEDLNFKWLTVTFDKDLYDTRKDIDGHLLISQDNQEKDLQMYGDKSYNKLVCNKMRIVLEILESCNVDVMFSDTDIAFAKDPFKHELGDKIASGQFDYIFQHNTNNWSERPGSHPCIKDGSTPGEGNTGFHYLKRTKAVKDLLKKTLNMCENEVTDDQSAFWKVMHASTDEWSYCPGRKGYDGSTEYAPREEGKNQFCCLDPYYYPVAFKKPANIDDIVMFHANYAAKEHKKDKLKNWIKDGWRIPDPK